MSRSYKKRNICWLACHSEKEYKQQYHRRYRRVFNMLLHNGEEENFPHRNKYYDDWCGPSDGKFHMDDTWIREHLESENEWDRSYILTRYKKDHLGRYHMKK